MMKRRILFLYALMVVLFLVPVGVGGDVVRLSEHVSCSQEGVNGVFVEKGGKTLVVYGDPGGEVEKADMVLFTHSRRDVVWAGRKLVEGGARSVVPEKESEKFSGVKDFWASFVQKRFHDYQQQGTKILVQPLRVDRKVKGGDELTWQGVTVRVLDTPGYTRGGVSYLVEIDGKKYGFVGDMMYGEGQILDLYSMQDAVGEAKIMGYHGWAGRLGDLIKSLRAVMKEKPDVLVPARGPVIKNPQATVELLIRRLQEVYKSYLSINAGHWYFKERYEVLARRVLEPSDQVDWMDYAVVVEKKPPDWVVPIRNSRLLISEAKRAFLIDCGSEAIIRDVEKLKEQGRFTQLDGLFITHYHDDHTEKVTELVEKFGCPVYACGELADILRRPEAHRLPAMTARPIANLTVVPEGHKRKWQEFQLTFYNFPGQTLYHDALLVEKDGGGKIFFIGDSFTPSGIDDYCLQNRNFLHPGKGYFYCLDLLHNIPAETLLTNQHVVEPFRYSSEQLKHMAKVLKKRKKMLEELFPWGGGNYGIDEQWAWFYPYGQKVRKGEERKISFRLFNHALDARAYKVRPNAPKGIQVKPTAASVSIGPGKEREIDFTIVIPKQTSETLYILTADVEFDQWKLHQWCEAMVEVTN